MNTQITQLFIKRLGCFTIPIKLDDENSFSIPPKEDNGFEVWFFADKRELTVGYEGWHEHFSLEEVDSAYQAIVFGLSKQCRLRVTQRGEKRYKWQLQAYEGHQWKSYSITTLLWFPFWKKSEIIYLQNNWI